MDRNTSYMRCLWYWISVGAMGDRGEQRKTVRPAWRQGVSLLPYRAEWSLVVCSPNQQPWGLGHVNQCSALTITISLALRSQWCRWVMGSMYGKLLRNGSEPKAPRSALSGVCFRESCIRHYFGNSARDCRAELNKLKNPSYCLLKNL